MADTHTVSIDVPNTVAVTLRGHVKQLDTTRIPSAALATILLYGIGRKANDPLGGKLPDEYSGKNAKPVPASIIDSYFNEMQSAWNEGKIAAPRGGGLGRTTDPVQREIKRLANAEIDKSLTKLLVHHGVGGVPLSRKEFDEKLRAKYVAGHMERNKERLEKEARANLAKLDKSGDVELLDIDASEDESEGNE